MQQETKPSTFERAWETIKGHWLELACLAFSATRTYDIVGATAPAVWLPAAGVAIMEGAWLFWSGRQEQARNKEQRSLAIAAMVLTWVTIGMTIAADAAWQASRRGFFGITNLPPWADAVAVYSIVAVAMLHIALFGAYRQFDPEHQLNLQERKAERELAHESRRVELEMRSTQQAARLRGWRREMSRIGAVFGEQDFNEEFNRRYKMYPRDVDRLLAEHQEHNSTSPATPARLEPPPATLPPPAAPPAPPPAQPNPTSRPGKTKA